MAELGRQPLPVGVARVDARGRCVYASDAFCKVLGFVREQLLGDGLLSIAPEVRGRIPERWDELRAGRSVTSVERYQRPDGRDVAVQIESMPELGADGRIASIILTCVDVSETEAAGAQVQGERVADRLAELEHLYEDTPVGLCLVDRELRYLRCNRQYSEIVGWPRRELIGATMHEVIPRAVRSQAIGLARQVLETGEPAADVEICAENPKKPEESRAWLVNVQPVRRGGRVVGATAGLQDITSLRRTEAAARDRLEQLEAVYEHTPAGLCVIDRELRYVRVNRRYARVVGLSPHELVGRPIGQGMLPPTRERAIALVRQVLESGESQHQVELHHEDPVGPARNRVWHANVHPVWHDGEVAGVIAAIQDVTRLHRAEVEANARIDELEAVYASSPVALSLLDRELRYVRVSQGAAELVGRPIAEIVGRRYRELEVPENAEAGERFLRNVIQHGNSVHNFEVRTCPPSDPSSQHTYLLSIDPMRDPAGGVVGLVCAAKDVTALRRTEDEAASRLEELELVYANAPVGLCHLDEDLRVQTLNERFASLCTAGDPSASAGRLLSDLLPGPIARQLVPRLSEVSRTGMASLGNQVRGAPPGEHHWIAGIHPAKRDGRVRGLVVVLQDVTPLFERQRSLEALRDRLTEAQRVSMVGSWEWRVVEDEMWWSPELYQICGEPESYVPSYTGFFEHVHLEDRQQVREQIERTVIDGEPHHLTCRVVRSDGSERALFTVARLERTAEGLPSRLVGTCQDITEFGPPGRISVRRLWKR